MFIRSNQIGKSRLLTTVENAFHNVCRHRGHPVTTKESGSTTVLACRFHGWYVLRTFDIHALTN
jgi:nitrite reductase/ring-hydroxylating ferredoxin subunit